MLQIVFFVIAGHVCSSVNPISLSLPLNVSSGSPPIKYLGVTVTVNTNSFVI